MTDGGRQSQSGVSPLTGREIAFLARLVSKAGEAALQAAAREPNQERLARAEWVAALKLKLAAIARVADAPSYNEMAEEAERESREHGYRFSGPGCRK